MGRPAKFKEAVKKYFRISPTKKGKCELLKCSFCLQEFAKNYYRMVHHLQICKKANLSEEERKYVTSLCKKNEKVSIQVRKQTEASEEEIETDGIASTSHSTSVIVSEDEQDAPISISSLNQHQKQKEYVSRVQLKNFIDHMNEEEQAIIWELLSRAVYATGMPLNFTENFYWKEVFKRIRPSLQLPSRYQLSGTLLDQEYDRIKEQVNEKLASSPYLSLQLDGWSNIRCEAVINVIITTPAPIVFKTIDSSERHTSEYIANIIQEVFDEVGHQKIISVVTDNAKNMLKAHELMQRKYPNQPISYYGCVAHILNLFVNDVIKIESFTKVEAEAKEIVKKVKYSHSNRAKFEAFQKQDENNPCNSLKLPVKTRWGSVVYCFKSLIDNKKPLQMLAISGNSDLQDELVTTILDNGGFWESVQILFDVLNSVLKWITILEADECRIPFVIQAFTEIKMAVTDIADKLDSSNKFKINKDYILTLLEGRKTQAIKNIHKAAHLLDPRAKGNLLSATDSVDAMEYITAVGSHNLLENVADVASEIAMYRNNSGIFQKQFVWDSLKKRSDGTFLGPITWWEGICGMISLSKIASAILRCSPTTAATERSFSSSSFIHSKRRNRMTNIRAAKITYIHHNLKKIALHDGDYRYFAKFNDPSEFVLPQNVESEDEDEELSESDADGTAEGNDEEEEVITLEVYSEDN